MKDSQAKGNAWVEPIASYLRDHRHACDSAEGIARWWLNAPVAEWPRIRCALEHMVSDGRLQRVTGRDGRVYYRLRAQTGGPSVP